MQPQVNRSKAMDLEEDPFLKDDVTSAPGQKRVYTDDGPTRNPRALLLLFVILFMLGLSAIISYVRDTDELCPGNMVMTDCPCFVPCDEDGRDRKLICPPESQCQRGCGCPVGAQYLINADTCSNTCAPKDAIVARDFSDCPAKKLDPLSKTEKLFNAPSTEIFHYRISPTYPCLRSLAAPSVDVLMHFTVLAKNTECDHKPGDYFVSYMDNSKLASAATVGCLNMNTQDFDQTIRGAWFFFVARLAGIPEDAVVQYTVGTKLKSDNEAMTRQFISPLSPGSLKTDRPILVLGDTATKGVKVVADSASKISGDNGYSLSIHVGDASYATNTGDCYKDEGTDPTNRCGYKCTGIQCHGADKIQSGEMLKFYTWTKVIDAQLGGKVAWTSTMGNHDNDLGWFLTYRPPVIGAVPGVETKYLSWHLNDTRFLNPAVENSYKQADAMEIMKNPHFFSFDHGLMHVIQIGTEDNPVNAYETWKGGPFNDDLNQRWEEHYGKDSKQYNWLVDDLRKASKRRKLVPWIAIYTHRPMYHTAQHHAWCAEGGDWYICKFVETYEPLLKQYGVNFFISGHSHHYQRSFPMNKGRTVPQGTVHLIVGVGTDEVVGENWVNSPEWIASRQGTKVGYARFWVKNSTSIYWEHIAAKNGDVIDSSWFTNFFV